MNRRRAALAAPLLLVALLAGCASGSTDRSTEVSANGERGWHGTTVTDGYPLPGQTFTDTAGDTVTPTELADRPVTLVFFGYTHCPDICNVVLANIASALRGASPGVRKDVQLLFVTTDPARDTPPVVREYLDRFDPAYEGLVAPVGTVAKAAKALYISYEKPDGSTGGSYEVDHGTYTTGFLAGTARVVWSADTTVADLRADLTRLAGLA
jgi:protein SCO1/2